MSNSKLANVQFMSIGRITDNTMLATFSRDNMGHVEKGAQYETATKLLKAATKRMQAGQRQKLAWGKDQVFAYLEAGDAELLVMTIMTGQAYPERIAFQMLVDLLNYVRETADEEARTAGKMGLKGPLAETFKILAKKYDDPDMLDKIEKAKVKTDAIKTQMKGNVANMLNQMENLNALEADAKHMSFEAEEYEEEATELKSYFWWKDLKVTCALGGFVLLIIAIIALIAFCACK